MISYIFYCTDTFLWTTTINDFTLTLYTPIPQNGQTHSSNSSAIADELFQCVWPFSGIGALKVNKISQNYKMII